MTRQTDMGQSWADSFLEAVVGFITAILLSIVVQQALFPVLDIAVSPRDTFIIALVFSGLSALRNLVVRRIFNGLSLHGTSLPQAEAH